MRSVQVVVVIALTAILLAGCEETETKAYSFPEVGLIAHYSFNNNANVEAGYGKHGIVEGPNMTSDRFGSSNSAYYFDGLNDFIWSLGVF